MVSVSVRYDATKDAFILKNDNGYIELYRETVKGLHYMSHVLDNIEEFIAEQPEFVDPELRRKVEEQCDFNFNEIKEIMLQDIVESKYNTEEEAMTAVWTELVKTPLEQLK